MGGTGDRVRGFGSGGEPNGWFALRREDELESDRLGLQFMAEAGYDPRGILELIQILGASRGSGGQQPEFFSSHPNPDNRLQRLQESINKTYPNGVPATLQSGKEQFAQAVRSRLRGG
jgi:predicted Zn-dependent protease